MSYCEQCAALQRQNDFLANDRDGYVQLLTDENNKLRAEVERLKALSVKADEAIARQQQDLDEAADRAADCGILRAQVDAAAGMLREAKTRNTDLTAEVEKLRAALELFACDCIDSGNLCPSPQNCRNYIARAALEGK